MCCVVDVSHCWNELMSWHIVGIEMCWAFVWMSFENKPQAYAEIQKHIFSPRGRIFPVPQVQHTLTHDLFLLVPLFSQKPLTLIFSALDEWLVEGFLTVRGELNQTNSERIIWVSHESTVKSFLCFTRLALLCFFFILICFFFFLLLLFH